jgi:hypothetical protein
MTTATGPDNLGCFQYEPSEVEGSGSGSGSGAGPECNSCMTPNSDAVQTICEQPRDLMEKVANLLKVVPEKSVPVMIYQNRNRTSTARKRNSVVALIPLFF